MAAMSQNKRGRGLPEQPPRPTSTAAPDKLRYEDVIDLEEVEVLGQEDEQIFLVLEELASSPETGNAPGSGQGSNEEAAPIDVDKEEEEEEEIFCGLEPLDLGPRYNAWILEDCN